MTNIFMPRVQVKYKTTSALGALSYYRVALFDCSRAVILILMEDLFEFRDAQG